MDLVRRFGLHFLTPIENLASILEHGLLSRTTMLGSGVPFVDISNHEVQQLRSRPDPIFGRPIHDYVPLFLNPRNPMLYFHRARQNRLVILRIDPAIVETEDVLFCDGNAAASRTQFSTEPEILAGALEVLEAGYWSGLADGTRRRMAEVLIPDSIPPEYVDRAVCRDHGLAQTIREEHDLYASVNSAMFF